MCWMNCWQHLNQPEPKIQQIAFCFSISKELMEMALIINVTRCHFLKDLPLYLMGLIWILI